jgi:hypothetical protein
VWDNNGHYRRRIDEKNWTFTAWPAGTTHQWDEHFDAGGRLGSVDKSMSNTGSYVCGLRLNNTGPNVAQHVMNLWDEYGPHGMTEYAYPVLGVEPKAAGSSEFVFAPDGVTKEGVPQNLAELKAHPNIGESAVYWNRAGKWSRGEFITLPDGSQAHWNHQNRVDTGTWEPGPA